MPTSDSRSCKIGLLILAIILILGVFLRLPPQAFAPGGSLHAIATLHPQPAFRSLGFDEGLYRDYVNGLSKGGLGAYPEIVDEYIEHQKKLTGSILPPVRFLYIFTAYVWRSLFGCDALTALHQVAATFSMLTLCLSAVFAWRLGGSLWMLATTALIAVAPTQIHMSQHALVDGFFTFWATLALWLFWENLRSPPKAVDRSSAQSSNRDRDRGGALRAGRKAPGQGGSATSTANWGWLVAYLIALSLLVITKENSAFVWFACVVLIIANRWLKFGIVTRELLIATVVGPFLGIVILVFLAGGIPTLFETYHLSITKNLTLGYAILTGDGPWYRYLVDLLLVSPFVLILAFGCLFRLDRTMKPEWFLSIFIAASYLLMCNLKYGMNLRYANMWDMPLRFLAVSCLVTLVRPFGKYQNVILGLAIALICAVELRDYIILAVQYPLYELVPEGLLRALHILKSP
jgi:hypothetical protein